jgi:hypothetical protein
MRNKKVRKIAVVGINLGHWRSIFSYLLILLSSYLQRITVSAKYRQNIRCAFSFQIKFRGFSFLFGALLLMVQGASVRHWYWHIIK